MISYKGYYFLFQIMYLLHQLKTQFFQNITTFFDEAYSSRVETPSDINRQTWEELYKFRDEFRELEKINQLHPQEKKISGLLALYGQMQLEDPDELGEADRGFLDSIESQLVSLLTNSRDAYFTQLQWKITEIDPKYSDVQEKFKVQLTNLKSSFDDTMDKYDTISLLQKDIDTIQSQQELLRLAILLHEDVWDIQTRHKVLDEAYSWIDDEQKLGLIWERVDTLTAGDIYSLKERGVDLATVFLAPPTLWENITTGSELIVNFWESQAAHKLIWIGDIIPIEEVYSIKVNGVEGVRGFSPRPWYYTPEGKYLAVYDGYKVSIGETKTVSEAELLQLSTARNERFQEFRKEDIAQILRSISDEASILPFSSRGDIQLLNDFLKNTGIKWVSYNSKTQKLILPEGIEYADIWEIIDGYPNTLSSLLSYILEYESDIVALSSEQEELSLIWMNISPILLEWALKTEYAKVYGENISFDANTQILKVSWGLKLTDILGWDYEYIWTWTKHLKYMSEIRKAASETWVPVWAIITLWYKENQWWDPTISAKGSSAYGLSQMIDGTWKVYGAWLNRRNPADQLLAMARYMSAIQERKNCPWEHVLAYYNTGEGIQKVSQSTIQNYANINPGISKLIPTSVWVSKTSYFTAAVAYYNSISYQEASRTI